MNDILLTNSLTRKKEKFVALNPSNVGFYTCGPTVYDFAHIGNFRTYTTADVLLRTLEFNGYSVNYVMNLTDVGHLTGDNVGDADTGEDRMEKAAKQEGKTAWDIAKFYTDVFINDMNLLNLRAPKIMPKATEHINEQIQLVQKLEKKEFTYKTSDGIYFDTKGFEQKTGKKYGELSTLDKIKEGARVEKNKQKKDPRDFALWKFSQKPGFRQMEWESPWGVGFPGWHIECSAMSLKYLGDAFDPFGKLRVNGEQSRTIDIHIGGEDLRSTHHPNEIAQSEAATGKRFVKYWIHVTFLQVEGKRMSKSSGNIFRIEDIVKKKIDPLALRYLYLTAHYRDTLNFTWESLYSSQSALDKLKEHMLSLQSDSKRTVSSAFAENRDRKIVDEYEELSASEGFRSQWGERRRYTERKLGGASSEAKSKKIDNFNMDFTSFINDDLNTSRALSVLWEVLKSNIPSGDKYELALSFDEVLGLNLGKVSGVSKVSREVRDLVKKREALRKGENFDEADEVRKQIEKKGYKVEDTSEGPRIRK